MCERLMSMLAQGVCGAHTLVNNYNSSMHLKTIGASIAASAALVAMPLAASALTVTCIGTPSTASISWAASSVGGIVPVSFLWGNGSTSSTQSVNVTPGIYMMSLSGTDASSTVATTTCSATVAQAAPTITAFTASPTAITAGQSTTLAWTVSNASSTSIDNGVGVVTGTATTVSPTVTTTYHLSATNPGGTTTASATVTVTATTTPPTGVNAQIAALLAQINALKAQILALVKAQGNGTSATTTPPVITPGLGRVCERIETNLSRGRHGGDVEKLQRFLVSQGLAASSTVTGSFGPMTEKALKQFQKKNGILSSGFFGSSTREFFNRHCEDGDDHKSSRPVASSTASSSKPAVILGDSGRDHDEDDDSRGRGRGRDD